MDTIRRNVTVILARALNVRDEEVVPEATLRDLGMDSMDLVDIVLGLEETFQIEIHKVKPERLETVQDLLDQVAQITSESGVPA